MFWLFILSYSIGWDGTILNIKIYWINEDEILLVCCETLNINNIEEVNYCIDFLESAVALKVKISKEKATINFENMQNNAYPKAIEHILHIAKNFKNDKKNIIEVEI